MIFTTKKPKVIECKIFNKDYHTRNLTTNQGIIAWKIDKNSTLMPNLTGIFYPKIIFSSFVLKPKTNNLYFFYEKILQYGFAVRNRQQTKRLVLLGIYKRKLPFWKILVWKDCEMIY
jgi:hypothetical protein